MVLLGALSRWFHKRVGETRGRFKRIMIVALARTLMVALWRYLVTGIVPEGAAVKALRRSFAVFLCGSEMDV